MCTGWDCQINGTIYKRTQNQQDRASDIRVLLDHVSWCSPSPRNQEVITNKEGEFSFNLYIHDTDTIRIKVEEIGCRIQLKFPSIHITDFIRTRILHAFQGEDFFVHQLNLNSQIYHIKKEDIFVTFVQKNRGIELTTDVDNKPLVNLIVAEEILELKDLLEGIKDLDSPDGMCEDLVYGLFSEDKKTK